MVSIVDMNQATSAFANICIKNKKERKKQSSIDHRMISITDLVEVNQASGYVLENTLEQRFSSFLRDTFP